MPSRSFALTLTLSLATIVAGLAIRFAPLGLPRFVVKYGGSMLWALMIYWIVSALLPSRRYLTVAVISGFVATAVEVGKLHYSPAVDAFRQTLPGILLLGRFFSVSNMVAYWLAIFLGVLVDQRIRTGERPVRR
jgi:hypothetical protein